MGDGGHSGASPLLAAAAQLSALACDRGALLAAGDLQTAAAAIVATSSQAGGGTGAAAWLERAVLASSLDAAQLLPGSGVPGRAALDPEGALLLRLRELASWGGSGGRPALLALAAAP